MNNNYISKRQLFMMMVLFQLGSSVVVLGITARQDAWIAILVSMITGIVLSFVYIYLYKKAPKDSAFGEVLVDLLGKRLGNIATFIYVIYYVYIVSRVLADLRFLIGTTVLRETPVYVLSVLLMLPILYVNYRGVKVLARTSELFFVLIIAIYILVYIFLGVDRLLRVSMLEPVLEDGWGIVFKAAFMEVIPVPFSETITFINIYPNVKEKEDITKSVISSVIFSGILLSVNMAVYIMVNTMGVLENLTFPLLTTISNIKVGAFIERLDLLAIIILIVVNFFKISVWFYSGIRMSTNLFGLSSKNKPKLILFIGVAVIFMSVNLGNIVEHYYVGSEVIPPYFHGVLLILVPLLLSILTFFKNRKETRKLPA